MTSKYSFSTLILATLVFSACAKTDSDFAAKYAKNKMGAQAVDAEEAGTADQGAQSKGVDIDIVAISKADNATERVVTATIILNNQQINLTTRHKGLEQVSGQTKNGNLMVTAYAVCSNAQCNPYYIALQAYKDGNLVIQEGVRKYFSSTSTSTTASDLDRYAKLSPEKSLPLMSGNSYNSADMSNGNVMIGYLAGNSSTGGTIKKN